MPTGDPELKNKNQKRPATMIEKITDIAKIKKVLAPIVILVKKSTPMIRLAIQYL
jgi:hypothetical protein